VSAISPAAVDLASPPASFTITGTGLANLGFGLPVVNFMRGSTMLAQVVATSLTGTTTLTVPFSSSLTVGPVQAQVYAQTGNATLPRTAVPSTGPLCHLCSSSAAGLPRPERAPVNDAQTISNAIPATSR
jgi:hypothetical protein